MDQTDLLLLRELEKGLGLTQEPFEEIGSTIGISADEVLRGSGVSRQRVLSGRSVPGSTSAISGFRQMHSWHGAYPHNGTDITILRPKQESPIAISGNRCQGDGSIRSIPFIINGAGMKYMKRSNKLQRRWDLMTISSCSAQQSSNAFLQPESICVGRM